MLPVLFLSQSIEQLGLQLESLEADFPLICFFLKVRELLKNILASGQMLNPYTIWPKYKLTVKKTVKNTKNI